MTDRLETRWWLPEEKDGVKLENKITDQLRTKISWVAEEQVTRQAEEQDGWQAEEAGEPTKTKWLDCTS